MELNKLKNNSIGIVIADDHPLVVSGLLHILGSREDMKVLATYHNGKDLLDHLAELRPQILLLDIQMPAYNGVEVAKVIAQSYPYVKVIALTNQDNIYYIRSMKSHGVLGYLLKTSKEEVLIDAIHAVMRGEEYLEPSLQERVDRASLNALQHNETPVISQRELEVLKYLAADLTSNEIAEKLVISKRTIDNHRTSLLTKLEVRNVAALIKKAIELGLLT